MNTAVLVHPFDLIDSRSVGLIGLPAERPAQQTLPGSVGNLLKGIETTLDQMILDVISMRTAEEFARAEEEVLPQYVSLVVAFARVVSKLVDRKTIVRLSAESFCELEAEIRENGEAAFGEALKERAMSTVWMLRKITNLLADLQTAPVGAEEKAKDGEFAEAFFLHAVRARFYIDCLVASMRTKRPLYRDTFPQVDDGLRSIINAYAWVKQSLDLRFPRNEHEPEAPPLTDIEEQAMRNHGAVHEPITPAMSGERLKLIRWKHVDPTSLGFCVGCGEIWPCDVSIVLEWLDLTSAILQTASDEGETEWNS